MTKRSPKIYRVGTLTYTKGTLAVLFFWLLWGDFCFVLMESVVPSILPLRFNALNAPNTVMAIALVSVPGFINMICNPVISFKSDRFRSRWGRRIPFIGVSAPFLVLSVVGLGFSDEIGSWLHLHFAAYLAHFSPTTITIGLMATLLTAFSFFNTFVNSVFWYLFNDVVPEHLLARFMSWFRLVSLGSSAVYNMFIFQYANSHFKEIFIGAGILYFFGFGLMCLKVKEGEYPPPPKNVDNHSGFIPAVKTYALECMSLPHYWYLFLTNMGLTAMGTAGLFGVFFNLSMGLTLKDMGELATVGSFSGAASILLSGWLADKYHPIRVVLVGVIAQLVLSPLGLMWLYWQPSPSTYFYVSLVLGTLLSPIGAMISVIDPPLFMRIFPRDRYGQFCSANSMCRSIAQVIAGPLVGGFVDILTAHYGAFTAYRLLPLWGMAGSCLVLLSMTRLYRSWHLHGGDAAYVPPVIGSSGINLAPNLIEVPQPAP